MADGEGITVARVDPARGGVLEVLRHGGVSRARLETFAAAVGELFASDQLPWESLLGRLADVSSAGVFEDVVLVAADLVYVARRPRGGGAAAVAIAPRGRRIGLSLAQARACMERATEEASR